MSKKRFIYHGYLQIAELDAADATESAMPVLRKTYLWDPLEPAATRILAMSLFDETGTWAENLYYTHDLLKNTTALFGIRAGRRALYEYGPYGNILRMEGNAAEDNPFRFSSEYADDELGLVYYNYRYYNPQNGRWVSRDPIGEEESNNLYRFSDNSSIIYCDILGLQLYEKKSEAFAAANRMVVEAMEKRYEQDLQKWNNTPIEKKTKKNKPVKVEFGVRICQKDCKYYVGKVGTSGGHREVSPLSVPPCDDGDKMIGYAHSHPDKNASLSDNDRKIAEEGFGGNFNIDENIKIPPRIIMTASVRDGKGNIRTHLYNPNRPAGKTNATFINGIRQ